MYRKEQGMKLYIIEKIEDRTQVDWESIKPAYILNYPWDKLQYRPRTQAKAYYTDEGLGIRFHVEEKEITARHCSMNDDVYKDSCVEFFVNPDPGNEKKYINFEFNALGVFLIQIGENRSNRTFLSEYDESFFDIKTSVTKRNRESYHEDFWTLEFFIPFHFIKRWYNELTIKKGSCLAGNFYKCGDETMQPHYGCWNPVVSEVPDFHRPECFGTLLLQ